MPGKASNSGLSRGVGAAVAALAVVLLVLDRATDLSVPYGRGGDGSGLGAAVALVAVAIAGWQYYRSTTE